MPNTILEALRAAIQTGAWDKIPTSFVFFIALLLFFIFLRVQELFVARRYAQNAAQRGEKPQREPMFVAMVILHTIPFWGAPIEVVLHNRAFSWPLAVVSCLFLAMAGVMRFWTLRTLGNSWNVRIVKPAHIVTEGPYQYIRHPNYAVVITELLFLPLVHSAWMTSLALTVINAWVLSRRIPAEEKVLFGLPEYSEKMGHKKRFLPGIF